MGRVQQWLQVFPGDVAFLTAIASIIAGLCAVLASTRSPGGWIAGVFIGALLVMYAATIFRRLVLVKRWPIVVARVLRSEAEEVMVPKDDGPGDPREWRPSVVYQYQHEGRTYRSQRFAVELDGFLSPKWGDAKNILLAYPPGGQISAHVCPTEPSLSVLAVTLSARRRSHAAAVLLGGLLVMATSFWVGMVT